MWEVYENPTESLYSGNGQSGDQLREDAKNSLPTSLDFLFEGPSGKTLKKMTQVAMREKKKKKRENKKKA